MDLGTPLTLAVSKGRILKQCLPLLASMGIELQVDPEASRSLIIPTNRDDIKLLVIRAVDVPTYVEYGAADLGIAGKDVLLEYQGEGLYEPLDLGIARCKLVLAGPPPPKPRPGGLPGAPKYVHTARRYFSQEGGEGEVIK